VEETSLLSGCWERTWLLRRAQRQIEFELTARAESGAEAETPQQCPRGEVFPPRRGGQTIQSIVSGAA